MYRIYDDKVPPEPCYPATKPVGDRLGSVPLVRPDSLPTRDSGSGIAVSCGLADDPALATTDDQQLLRTGYGAQGPPLAVGHSPSHARLPRSRQRIDLPPGHRGASPGRRLPVQAGGPSPLSRFGGTPLQTRRQVDAHPHHPGASHRR